MFAVATASLLTLVQQLSGTPYISGGDSQPGTDCSGLVSFVTNAATGRPVYGDRFNTGNIESALKARGFQYGSKPGALNVGWNGGHTAATLPDGTPVSSGEGGGVRSVVEARTRSSSPSTCTSSWRLRRTSRLPPGVLPPPPGEPMAPEGVIVPVGFDPPPPAGELPRLRLSFPRLPVPSCPRLPVPSCRRPPVPSCPRPPVPSSRRHHCSHKRRPRGTLRSRPAANTRQLAPAGRHTTSHG